MVGDIYKRESEKRMIEEEHGFADDEIDVLKYALEEFNDDTELDWEFVEFMMAKTLDIDG